MMRWRFAWSWFVGAVIAVMLPACAGITLPDGDGDGLPDIIDPCPTNPDPTCVPSTPAPEPYDCANPPALTGLVKVRHPLVDRYVVVLKPASQALGMQNIAAFASRFKGVAEVKPLVRAFAAKIEAKALGALLADPAVQFVQQEGTKHKLALSWGLDRVDQRALPLDKSFAPDGDGAGIDVYINDTGVTKTNDLGDRLSSDCFSTIVSQGCNDGHGHGTHVAGTAAGTTWGIAKKATVHSVRFLDANGSGSDSDAIRTLDWIAQHAGGGVVNASWGGDPAPTVDAAVCRVIESGKVFVAAAGNESSDSYNSTPARIVQVVTVGASDDGDNQAYFSNFGPGLDVYAPGVDIESDTPSGGTTTMSGTSMATPHVVGAIALLLQKYPGETPAQIRDRLVAAATEGALKGIGTGSPNLLLYVGKEAPPSPGGTPPKGEPVGPDRLLRPDGTRLKTNAGQPFDMVMAVPCCMPWSPESILPPRVHVLRVNGVEKPTLWPLTSAEWVDYTAAKGAANAFHFRGPFLADGEPEWTAVGGAYRTPSGEWNPFYWQTERDLVWHAYQMGAYIEKVVIDTWGCKYSQAGNPYVPWSEEAIQACGRTWHPEHERYARKVVEELGCFGNVIWALDNEGQNIQGWQGAWFRQLGVVIRDEEKKSGCGFVHMIGTSVGDVQGQVDYSITHQRAPLTVPIASHWSIDNEHNPAFSPAEEEAYFTSARNVGLAWALWRAGMTDVEFEDTLARFKAVVDGSAPPPPPPPQGECLAGTCPAGSVYINAKHGSGKYGDSTMRCGDRTYCEKATGIPGTVDCALGIEGTAQREICELAHAPGCHRWQFQGEDGKWTRCLPAPGWASCDHFERWSEGTAYTGPCEVDASGAPIAGWETIPRGNTYFRACGNGSTAAVCSDPVKFDQ